MDNGKGQRARIPVHFQSEWNDVDCVPFHAFNLSVYSSLESTDDVKWGLKLHVPWMDNSDEAKHTCDVSFLVHLNASSPLELSPLAFIRAIRAPTCEL